MGITVKNLQDLAFRKYGRVLPVQYDVTELLEKMKETPMPEDVVYVPSVKELEELPIAESFRIGIYGELPIQIGYCNGHNHLLNAVEYHKSSEINVALHDMILLIGMQQDIADNFTYESNKIEAFLVPAGTAVELYATTLHYAPCGVDGNGFQTVIVLPKDTNTELQTSRNESKEDSLLVAKNKWLIAHKDAAIEGAFVGIIGDNISVAE